MKDSSIKSWSEENRPRERMMQKGYTALSDAELIAILIQSGTKEKSAVDLAHEILRLGAQNLSELGRLTIKDFQKVKGIGEARAITLVAALELGRRRQLAEVREKVLVNSSKVAAELLAPIMSDLPHEKFCVLCLGHSNKLIHYEFVSSGGLSSTLVDPRIIFHIALQHLASKLIVAHNHPSGNLKPSEADKAITQKLKDGARLLDMQLVDHIIIAEKSYLSFADEGLL